MLGATAIVAQRSLSIQAALAGTRCQYDNERSSVLNVAVWSCFAAPEPATGRWQSSLRLRGSVNASGTYTDGYEMLVEGQRDQLGREKVNRWALWDFGTSQTVLAHSDDAPDLLTTNISIWTDRHVMAAGGIGAVGGYSAGPSWLQGVTGNGDCKHYEGGICTAFK